MAVPTYLTNGTQLWYMDSFTVAASALTCVVNGTNTATVAAGEYVMDANIATKYTGYTLADFGTALMTALNAAVPDVTWSVYMTSGPSPKLAISRSTNFSIDWTGATGQALQKILGFNTALSGNNGYTANRTPWYLTVPGSGIAARTSVTDLQEADGFVEEAVADDNSPYAVSRAQASTNSDWIQGYEPIASVYERRALALGASSASDNPTALLTVAYTWQAFWRNVRGQRPFFVYDGSARGPGYTVHKLRADGGSFKPQRVSPDFDDYWNISFRTRDLGLLFVG